METTATVNSYAEALKNKFKPSDTTTTDNKYNMPPARKPSCKFQFTFDPNEFPNLANKKPRQSTNETATSSVTTEHTKNTKNTTPTAATTQQTTTTTSPQKTKIDFDELKEEIRKSLQADLQCIVQNKITPIRNQLEPLQNEMRTNNDNLSTQMESLTEMLNMLNTRFDALNNTNSQSPSSTNGKGDGKP